MSNFATPVLGIDEDESSDPSEDVDEKSKIQALDRTAPILPLRAGLPEHLPRLSPEARRSTMTIPSLSVSFATSPTSADDIVVAEQLGYANAWFYDTPQQSPDVWMTLAKVDPTSGICASIYSNFLASAVAASERPRLLLFGLEARMRRRLDGLMARCSLGGAVPAARYVL